MSNVPPVIVQPREAKAGERPIVLVRVTDIDISFGQMVVLLVKLAIASIPAAILLFIIVVVLVLLFGGLLGGAAGIGSFLR